MNRCPKCGADYADVTLRFCLQDGTPLVHAAPPATHGGGPGSQVDMPTAVLDEAETRVVHGGDNRIHVSIGGQESEAWRQSQVTRVAGKGQYAEAVVQPPSSTGSKTLIAVGVTAVLMFILFCIIGLAAWLLLRNPGEVAKNTGPNLNIYANNSVVPTPTATGTPFSTPTRTATPTPTPQSTPSSTPTPELKSYPSTTRLTMARGSYSTSFSGDLNPGGSRSLVLGCRSGQSLTANVSGSSCVHISGGGSSLRTITNGGDNYIHLNNTCSTVAHFSISITII
jgi:hypothetical protein